MMTLVSPPCPALVIQDLPNEILVHIFQLFRSRNTHLSCLLVCRRWHDLCVEHVWHRLSFSSLTGFLQMSEVLRPPYSNYVRRINLSLLGGELAGEEAIAKLSLCNRVEKVSFGGCKSIPSPLVTQLVQQWPNLLSIDLSELVLDNQCLLALSACCRQLQSLNISGSQNVEDEALLSFREHLGIKRLKCAGCLRLGDASVQMISSFRGLTELDLAQCGEVTDASVSQILEHCITLRELRLAACVRITDLSFARIHPDFNQLRILDLTSCSQITDATIGNLIQRCPRLRHLVLAKCVNLTDAAISHIAKLGKQLHNLVLGHCARITDKGVATLTRHCTRIRYLDLACCNQLTDASMYELGTLPKLRRVGLVKCASITDRGIYGFMCGIVACQSLERLHLSYCVQITVPGILRLLNITPQLTHITLTGIPAFLRADLQKFSRAPPKDFSITQLPMFCVFSGDGVRAIRDYIESLPIAARTTYHGDGPLSMRQLWELLNLRFE
ncbi:RNI-like protein [Basidiobolus meristosporus CBS 931.73]|uniref:RNI-like protein n=1 Tax=Basidiobolus meristosporus CBS 931.73 TaxID=1314790 RepID=A0A1Y1Y9P2_9FUNG|nr:RNI-like protein [Basidiobolus meristosporus CBS 931.73]|eukprot:ORX94740.1 RNI-like protein [Basidiobolus meristosporus CBS 931.73]